MKKLQQTLVVGAMLALPVIGSAPAKAASTCEIGFTGPDSNNLCISKTTTECEVENNNSIKIGNESFQFSGSGNASNTGNTSGGGATTGTVTNSNGTDFAISITNGGSEVDQQVCTATAIVPATTTPTPVKPSEKPTPVETKQPGMGGAVKETVSAPVENTAPLLANTSGDNTVAAIAGILVTATAATVAMRFGAVAYIRRLMQ